MTRIVPRTTGIYPGRARLGLRMRAHPRPGGIAQPREWACPDCALVTRDEVAIRLGYCSQCRDFTGMCGAGRKVLSPGVISATSWHTPCTSLGTVPWQVMEGATAQGTRLCPAHDEQLRSGAAPWVRYAIPVDEAPGAG